jgi:alpha-mannosidase
MANQSGIDEILLRWRDEIKKKQRRIISFEETVEIKVKSLKKWIYPDTESIESWEFREFIYTRHREKKWRDENWRTIKVGETWGGPDVSALFRTTAKMPARFAGKKVVLKSYFGGDGLLSLNGAPYHGLDPFRDTVPLTDMVTGDEVYNFEVESYIFWHFGESEVKTLEASHFAVMDDEMNDTYWDFQAAYNVMVVPDQDEDLAAFLKEGFCEAIAFIDQNEKNPEIFRENARKARAVLHEKIYRSELFQKDGLMHMCGNSHLDIVFLWTEAEFVRKLGRTHATALRLMEQFPNFIFSQSQPMMYAEMKKLYPSMYEEVKARIKEGRWEAIGAFWVEPDCNLISGESFVRQILYGTQFMEREFGVTPHTCWCPDVFGNAWTMPQILLRSGLKYFVTHKMVVWNDTNPWVKNSFWWQGPDGSRVLSLVPPTHFIGTNEPDHMAKHWKNFSDKTTIGESLYNYGWGDGGGGPDVEMLEYMKRYGNFPGMTPTIPNTIEGALDSIAAKAELTDLPIVNDELYLEEHRGVHTTKARLKKLNRRCELLYRSAELWSNCASLAYPTEAITSGWKDVLTNQFHDSLPGSHIPPVYLDLLETYDRTVKNGTSVRDAALNDIVTRIDTSGEGEKIVVFNQLLTPRDTVATVAYPQTDIHIVDAAGAEVLHQFITDFETGDTVLAFQANNLPPVGFAVFSVLPGGIAKAPVSVTANSLENDFIAVKFNGEGEIISLYDKQAKRETIDPKLKGNVFKLYEDVPGKYEAWDIAPSYTDVEFDISGATVQVYEQGPLRSSLLVTRNFRNSKLKQLISLTSDGKRVEFDTWVDWHEQQKLLKVRFNTPITTRIATYDIPYGNIERSTYRNNSFDAAKFEVPAHQWMDISQADYGLSLLNDCKYGHEALEKMIALTLLRGPLNPDPTSDQEEHRFKYALYPHAGTWRCANTIDQALDINDPAVAIVADNHPGQLPASYSFIVATAKSITIEAVKKAEDSDAIIIRVVERHGINDDVIIKFAAPIKSATECNLLEREDTPVKFDAEGLYFTILPYEIRTFKVKI